MKAQHALLTLAATAALFAAPLATAQTEQTNPPAIPGYALGDPHLPSAPFTLAELESLKATLLLGDEDIRYLRASREILADQTAAILDVWYGFVAATPELLYYFQDVRSGEPHARYLAAVRKRFEQWILDTAAANYDQTWLDYQFEIGRRHHQLRKNRTDHVTSVRQVNFRYLPALTIPITTTLRPFLAAKGASAEEVDKMQAAWVKAVLLQSILWSYPYVREGQF